jgi:hypothetical protein
MAEVELHIDEAAIGEILTVAARGPIDSLGAQVAAAVQPGRGIRVRTSSYTTDRAACAVIMYGRRAMSEEAQRGALIRAASSLGLEVRSRG